MANRTRSKTLKIYVSEEEYEFIQRRMARIEMVCLSRYAREMLLHGYIIHKNYPALRELTKELGSLARSINQIAKQCNETKSVHTWQVEELKRGYAEVKRACTERLVKMAKE